MIRAFFVFGLISNIITLTFSGLNSKLLFYKLKVRKKLIILFYLFVYMLIVLSSGRQIQLLIRP